MGFPGLGRLGSAEFQVELLRREIAVLKVAAVRGMKADKSATKRV